MIGNLIKDPEKIEGQNLCRLSIAVRNNYKNKDGEYDSEFFNLSVWNKLHENCMKYLQKGSKISFIGELHIRSYEKDGIKKYMPEIIVQEIEFLSSIQKKEEEPQKMTPIDDDSLPF